jgi:Tfp pilus assembly protein PilF
MLAVGDEDEAKKEFEASLMSNARDAEANLKLGEMAVIHQDWDAAMRYLQAAIKAQPGSYQAHLDLGKVFQRQNSLDEAGNEYRTAIRLDPHKPAALVNLAKLLQSQNKPEEAQVYFERLKKLQQAQAQAHQAELLNAGGLKLLAEGNLAGAVKAFNDALSCDPLFFAAAHNLGTALARQGRTDQAIEAFKTALRLRPTLAVSHYGLAVMLKSKNDPAAEEEFRRAEELRKFIPAPE